VTETALFNGKTSPVNTMPDGSTFPIKAGGFFSLMKNTK